MKFTDYIRREISPPAWGWPAVEPAARDRHADFPTRVGMARPPTCSTAHSARFPHPRGDGPLGVVVAVSEHEISPPAWGWPVRRDADACECGDFPTRVGMARTPSPSTPNRSRFPHPRGDGPELPIARRFPTLISPPAWGWPGVILRGIMGRRDFPTRVGMARSR